MVAITAWGGPMTGREPLEIAIDSPPASATKRLKGRSRMKASAAEKTDAWRFIR
jgi:hypothetical protein